jgi:hypothetical protein
MYLKTTIKTRGGDDVDDKFVMTDRQQETEAAIEGILGEELAASDYVAAVLALRMGISQSEAKDRLAEWSAKKTLHAKSVEWLFEVLLSGSLSR